ncbi:MAG: Bacterial Ig-like domain, partial [Miltoncostaeaceae bacterium]|nr:Bacterial Ig-like domain [Miltoncostaeaceae bacterium]
MTLPTTDRTLGRARLRRVGATPSLLLALLALLAGGGVAAAALPPPTIAGPTGAVKSPPSYTITGDPAAHIQWAVCQDASVNCVQGAGDGQVVTGPLPSGAASTADGVYLLSATQTLAGASATAVISFSLDRSAPPVPTNVRSTSAAGASRPSFAWAPAEPGGSFDWEIRPAGATSGPAADSGAATTASATVGSPLADGSYAFRVRQVDEAGNAGPWSAPLAVTTGASAPPPNPPEITSATPSPGNPSPTFTWRTGTAPGIDRFSWQINAGQTVVAGPTTTTETQATVPSPLAPGDYSFRVVESDPSGARSAPAR